MSSIDFYFDFLSPYAYLAHSQLPALAEKYGCRIDYKPIDLKAVKLAAGNTGPATVQIPAKLKYFMADMNRWCDRYDIPFAFGRAPPVTERANKGVFLARQKGQEGEYVTALWRATFGSGGEFNSDPLLTEVATRLGWAPQEFLEFVESSEADRLFEQGNREAQERGVFGVPTMMVGDEMWWGNDRLDFLEEYLTSHPPK